MSKIINSEREALLEQITMLDFMLVDLHLYLNTHPDCAETLEMYNKIATTSDKARHHYEVCYGPLYSFRSLGGSGWTWENKPWPWQKEFNFCFQNERR